MRVAIVHDWLVTYAGAERVLEQLLAVYPDAHLYSLIDFVPPKERGFLGGRTVKVSFLQRLPGARRHYRQYLPLMPLAIEQFDLAGYDLVISSSHAIAKGVLTGPDQLHLCICHSPMRYAWDLQHEYLRQAGLTRGLKSAATRYLLHRLRIWDARSANGVDGFVAVSHFIAARIMKAYRRSSVVIYPPVDVEAFSPGAARDDFYVTASRMVPYKRMDLIVQAFATRPDRRLVVIGDGPEAARVRSRGAANIEFMGHQPFEILRDRLQRARAFVFAAEEDFGIAPLEAQACGTPVIAYAGGGVRETIAGLDHPEPTGVLFCHQTVESLLHGLDQFEQHGHRITPDACRRNAVRFSPERFRRELQDYVASELRRREEAGGGVPGRTGI